MSNTLPNPCLFRWTTLVASIPSLKSGLPVAMWNLIFWSTIPSAFGVAGQTSRQFFELWLIRKKQRGPVTYYNKTGTRPFAGEGLQTLYNMNLCWVLLSYPAIHLCWLCNWRSSYVQDTSPHWHDCSQVQPGRSSKCILSIFAHAGAYKQYQEKFAWFVHVSYSNRVQTLSNWQTTCFSAAIYRTLWTWTVLRALGAPEREANGMLHLHSRKSRQHCQRIQRWKFKLFAS